MIRIVILIVMLWMPAVLPAQDTIYFNHPPPTAEIFAPGIISTSGAERDFALSPDGNELLYTMQAAQGLFQTLLLRTKNSNGSWSAPVVAPFAGNYSDLEPAFSSDGSRLYFSSNRPLSGHAPKDFDIWFVEKHQGRWGEPENAGPSVNTTADEFFPSVATDGSLYFTANYTWGVGKEDIYRAQWKNGGFEKAMVLDTAINSSAWEFNAFVSPTEDFIIFSSFGRMGEQGGGDLYISRKDMQGRWMKAQNLRALNSPRLDYCPFVTADRKILFFTSERTDIQRSWPGAPVTYLELAEKCGSILNGSGNIYWVSFNSLNE